ncbi:MAG: hypothetical protein MUP63_02560 [Candidatus Nanohaloarchaeota archaeon QJJ-7]|nr:hypothetical protein [Candidatus Nanohaloarchaeota archaeon QJJ-7]
MVEKIEKRIEETDKEKFPSQVLKDYYTATKQLMEALAASEGVKSSGEGAHKKLINWVAEEYNLKESERQFLQQMRKYRNRITYEGFNIEYGYLERNQDRIENVMEELERELEDLYGSVNVGTG